MFTKVLAKEIGRRKITVNAIAPGFNATEANAELTGNAAARKRIEDMTLFGRFGEPSDIADIVHALASPAGGWVTGCSRSKRTAAASRSGKGRNPPECSWKERNQMISESVAGIVNTVNLYTVAVDSQTWDLFDPTFTRGSTFGRTSAARPNGMIATLSSVIL